MRRLGTFLLVIVAGTVLVLSSLALLAPQVTTLLEANAVATADAIDLDPLAQRSVVLAADGSVLTYLLVEENRVSISLDEVSQTFIDTLLAIEDNRFYDHDGINVRATARALLENVSAGGVEQGGSTITQQLVKNALVGSEQSLERKVQEAVLARRLEDQMTKDEILERYLNTVYLGNSTYGVQAAAELYFGVAAADLDLAQSALLVGMIQNPVGLDPFLHPEDAKERRAEVLNRLLAIGDIEEDVATYVKATPIPTEGFRVSSRPKDYFVEEVKERLLADERLGATQSERYNAVFRGGLTIRTTVEPRLQQLADEAVREVLPDTGGTFTASIVSIDPRNGAVRAMVGGPGFGQAQYNIATQGVGRQAGSSFKPFVLATILEQGNPVVDTVNGRGPCTFPNPGGQESIYEVENFDRDRGGTADLRQQTLRSSNCAYVRLGIIAGLQNVMNTAARLGISTQLRPELSASLGANEVRPIDMASAYGVFANDGVRFEPYYVEEVRDRDGNLLFGGPADGERVLDEGVARNVTSILADNVQRGTGTRARFPDGRRAAGKTGTTQDHSDAWFVGYTKELSTAVWMGSPLGRVTMENVGGVRRVTGGSFPASMWQAFMGPALEPYAPIPFAEPPPPPPQVRPKQLLIPGERAEPSPAPQPRRRPPTTTTAGPTSTTQTTATTAAPATTTTTAAPVATAQAPPPPPAPPATGEG